MKYAKVPIAAIMDTRLSHRQFKVLCALLSFADQMGRCHPTNAQLCERTGIDERNLRRATTALVEFGYLVKIGSGGRSRPCDYLIVTRAESPPLSAAEVEVETSRFEDMQTGAELAPVHTPETGAELAPQEKSETGANLAPKGGPIWHQTGANLAPRIQQTINIPTTDHEAEPSEKLLSVVVVAKPKKSSALTPEMQQACRATWDAYALAYLNRYGVEPVKNAKSAGQVVQFVKRIGIAESRHVAAFYLTHSAAWYVKTAHSVDAMLKDAEKLRMEWATNRKVTSASAQSADKREAAGAAVSEYLSSLEARYGTA